jgi:hypothetical protein
LPKEFILTGLSYNPPIMPRLSTMKAKPYLRNSTTVATMAATMLGPSTLRGDVLLVG